MRNNDSQRLVITDRVSRALTWLPVLLLVTILLVALPPLGKVISGIVGLFLIAKVLVVGKKVVIDKVSKRVVVENRSFFFSRRQRVMPFAAISRVVVDREVSAGGPYGGSEVKWKLSIVVGGAKVAIEDSKNEWEIWSLGQRISQLTGKEMVDRSSGKGEARFDPNVSRGEIVKKWKKQIEEEREAKERKK